MGGPFEAEEHDSEFFSGSVPIAIPSWQLEPLGNQHRYGRRGEWQKYGLEVPGLDSTLGRSHPHSSDPDPQPDTFYFNYWCITSSRCGVMGPGCCDGLRGGTGIAPLRC